MTPLAAPALPPARSNQVAFQGFIPGICKQLEKPNQTTRKGWVGVSLTALSAARPIGYSRLYPTWPCALPGMGQPQLSWPTCARASPQQLELVLRGRVKVLGSINSRKGKVRGNRLAFPEGAPARMSGSGMVAHGHGVCRDSVSPVDNGPQTWRFPQSNVPGGMVAHG